MRAFFLTLITVLSFTALFPTNVHAAEENTPLVKIRLLAEKGQVIAGEEIWIGTEQSIADHWHTYWKNPGDSGTPPSIAWNLPQGFEVSDIHWPAPKKLPYGPLLNYGYENNVLLLQKLTIPDELPSGEITLTADVELLVCKEECIPEYGTYTLTLNGENSHTEDNSAYFNRAKQTLPEKSDLTATYAEEEGEFALTIKSENIAFEGIDLNTIEFFPGEWGIIANASPPQTMVQDGALIIKHPRDKRPLSAVNNINGVLKFTNNNGQIKSHALTANQDMGILSIETPAKSGFSIIAVLKALIFALVGGLILNLMPCVFPVLSIKALSLIKIAEKHPHQARLHGIAYTAGVISSFLLIAGILIILQTGGSQIGWGFQLQNPLIVGLLGYLLFIIGLNLIGFFEFINPFANFGGTLASKQGPAGSFFTGILATLVATPCTAPFMAGAIGFALVQPWFVSLTIFAALGFGLALPYLVLSFVPAAQKILPKPGAWMEIFKQVLAFPMFIAALWLFWVIAQQTGIMGGSSVLLGAILISFAIWLLKIAPIHKTARIITHVLAVIAALGAVILIPTWSPAHNAINEKQMEFGQSFTEEKLETALDGSNPVFTEMTAAWCITCKVNHAVAINIDSTKSLFTDNNVEYMIGDWTNEDPKITKYLKKYGRSGVPLYVFYGPRDPVTNLRPEPKVLPQVLTPAIIKDFIEGES